MDFESLPPAEQRRLREELQRMGLLKDQRTPVVSSPATPAAASVSKMDEVGLSDIKEGIRNIYLDVWKSFSSVQRLRRAGGGYPKLEDMKVSILSVLPATVFTEHFVVVAQCNVQLRLPETGGKRCRSPESQKATDAQEMASGGSETKSSTPPGRGAAFTRRWRSMHFVLKRRLPDGDTKGSYEFQSVELPDEPTELDCVARLFVHVGLLFLGAQRLLHDEWQRRRRNDTTATNREPKEKLSKTMPFCADATALPAAWSSILPSSLAATASAASDSSIVILGMGGNVMYSCLHAALPRAKFVIAELEPAVVASCVAALQFSPPEGTSVLLGDVVETASKLARDRPATAALIILDCFDPIAVSMLHSQRLLEACFETLVDQGVLVVNAHIDVQDGEALLPFVRVFGSRAVHAVKYPGLRQGAIVCVRYGRDVPEAQRLPLTEYSTPFIRRIAEEANRQQLFGALQLDTTAVTSSCNMVVKDDALTQGPATQAAPATYQVKVWNINS